MTQDTDPSDNLEKKVVSGSQDQELDVRTLSKLKWRCRRGLLENDLLIARFFVRYESSLTLAQAQGLSDLMDLSDNDLLDLLLKRKQPDEVLDGPYFSDQTLEVLGMLQVSP